MTDFTLVPIEELIPHSPPMVLIHRIVSCDAEGLVAEVNIDTNSMFYEPDIHGVPTWVGIEYIAQSIAAFGGIKAKRKGEGVKSGFLLGTRRFHTFQTKMKSGKSYRIAICQVVPGEFGLTSFNGRISEEGTLVCEARVNVFEADNT